MNKLNSIAIIASFGRLGRESAWIIAGQAGAVLGTLAAVVVLTRYLGSSAYGEFALALTVVTLVNQLVLGPIGQGAIRYFSVAEQQNGVSGFLRSLGTLTLQSVFVIALIAIALIGALNSNLIVASPWVWELAVVFAIVTGLDGIVAGLHTAARRRAVVAVHMAAQAWLKIVCSLGFMYLWGFSVLPVLLGYLAAITIVLLSQIRILRSESKKACGHSDLALGQVQWKSELIKYSWPFAVWGVFISAHLVSDRWVLKYYSSSGEVGIFMALFQLGYYPLTLLAGILSTLMAPVLFSSAGDGTDGVRMQEVSRTSEALFKGLILVSCVVFVLCLLIHNELISLFLPAEYAEFSYLWPFLILSGGIFTAGQILTLERLSTLKSSSLLAPKIVTAIIGIGLNIIGAYSAGLEGLIAANLGFSFTYSAWLYLQFKRAQYTLLRSAHPLVEN